jgi:hypothetical protein
MCLIWLLHVDATIDVTLVTWLMHDVVTTIVTPGIWLMNTTVIVVVTPVYLPLSWTVIYAQIWDQYKCCPRLICVCNALTTFMRVMNDVYRPFLDDFVIVYLYDIIIFRGSWDEHLRHVKQVLDTLQREKLYVKLPKCEFGKTALVYLGHIVGGGQLKIDPSKIDVIVNWPKPKSVTKVGSFLGAIQCWRRFISNFSFIAAPLHALTSVKNTFQWEGKQQKSFDTLKEKINTAPVLALSNLQKPFDIKKDAIRYAMGGVLMLYHKPIYYHSETFNQAVVNYPTYDKELYALVQGIKKWKNYLLGK